MLLPDWGCFSLLCFCLFFIHLYWSIIALQWCVSFCCITKWISYTYTYILISPPSCVSLPSSLSHPSRWPQSTKLISLCYAAASHQLSILHLAVYICPCHSLALSQLTLPLPVSSSPFSASAFLFLSCIWLLLFNIISVRFIHITGISGVRLFYRCVVFHCMNKLQFLDHLTATCFPVHVFGWTHAFISVGNKFRRGIAGSRCGPKWLYQFSVLYKSSFILHPYKHWYCGHFCFSHSS